MSYNVKFNPVYHIEYDYDVERDCDAHGCEGICRCGKIVNEKVTDVNLSIDMFTIDEFFKTKHKPAKTRTRQYAPTMVESYCIDRLLRIHKAYAVDSYQLFTENDYYGETISGAVFDGSKHLEQDVLTMLNFDYNIDKIKFVLEREYTYLLSSLAFTTKATIVKIEPSSLLLNTDYMVRLKRETIQPYKMMSDLPVGIVLNNRLIDGYHRYGQLVQNKKYPFIELS